MRKMRGISKRLLSLSLVLVLVLSSLPVGALAARQTYYGPDVLSVALNESRTVATLWFNKAIEANYPDIASRIQISTNGSALAPLPAGTTVTLSGYSFQINLPESLNSSDNFFFIMKDTFSGQTIDLETNLFDARGPVLADNNSVFYDHYSHVLTLRFSTSIKGNPSDSALTNGGIYLARDGVSFNELIPARKIRIDQTLGTITINFDEPLLGTNARIKILSGKLKNPKNNCVNAEDLITPAIDASAKVSVPEINYVNISTDRKTVNIYFTKEIGNSFAKNTTIQNARNLLKARISIRSGGSSAFVPLGAGDSITTGEDYISIKFASPLATSENYIKIAGSSLLDGNGKLIENDIITNNFTSGSTAEVLAPEYMSASLLSDGRVQVVFSAPVQKNSSYSASAFRKGIKFSRNGGAYEPITSYDTVSFAENTMTIRLNTPLTGTNNRLQVSPEMLVSKTGIVLEEGFTTGNLSRTDSNEDFSLTAPEYSSVTYDANTSRIKIKFKANIKLAPYADFTENILVSRNGGTFTPLTANDIVSISPTDTINIIYSQPIVGNQNAIRILGNTVADYNTGYVQQNAITTGYFGTSASSEVVTPENPSSPAPDSSVSEAAFGGETSISVSDDFYTIVLKFNEAIYNNLSSLSELKGRISVSRSGFFAPLGADDYIRFGEKSDELVIVLARPCPEYLSQVKISEGALRNASGIAFNKVIATLPFGEAEGSLKVYLNNNAVSSSPSMKITDSEYVVTLSDSNIVSNATSGAELLVKVPTIKSRAVLNISKPVADALKSKNGSFSVSLGAVTHTVPSANLPVLADGETLSLEIDSSSNSAQGKLSSESSAKAFTVAVPLSKLSAFVVSSDGTKKAINHTAFASKRFMVKTLPSSGAYSTVVRVENSGAIVPVPSNASTGNGVLYLTAKTLSDGNYAAITSSHSFKNTPSWVIEPANILGSKLILTNANGSDLLADQAISRAETVTLLSRALGILSDTSGASPFFDIITSDSYFGAVMSSVSHKLISGYPDSTFKPTNTLTRTEAMVIIARAMRFLNGNSSAASLSADEAKSVLSKFADANTVDSWAASDIAECVKAGVVNGDNKGNLNPKSNVTRAQFIQLIYNVLKASYNL